MRAIATTTTTKVDGKILSRASLVSHRKGEGFSLSFQMPREAFDESTIMIAVVTEPPVWFRVAFVLVIPVAVLLGGIAARPPRHSSHA